MAYLNWHHSPTGLLIGCTADGRPLFTIAPVSIGIDHHYRLTHSGDGSRWGQGPDLDGLKAVADRIAERTGQPEVPDARLARVTEGLVDLHRHLSNYHDDPDLLARVSALIALANGDTP